MNVTTIETAGLGDRSYVISHDGIAVVVDPQRDVDRILEELQRQSLEAVLVCETHVHNDYVTGGLALSRMTGSEYAVNAEDDVAFQRREVTAGESINLGALQVRVVATPGHTPTHLSYLISDGNGDAVVCTGGSMLYGTVGRTDLIGADRTDDLTRAQYRSVRGLASDLDERTVVLPTHGFGSFCASAGGASRTSGTIADERDDNIACTTEDEDEFVRTLRDGFAAHPPYYAHMGLLNRSGPLAPDLNPPPSATAAELAGRIATGEWVVDLRPRGDFARGHLAGSVSVDIEGAFATYLGWAIPWGTPLSFVADTAEQVEQAQREAVRIGLDRPSAMAFGGPAEFAKGQRIGAYRQVTFAELGGAPDVHVVDVRRTDEWDMAHIDGAVHVPMEDLAQAVDSLPEDGPLWVHCASGYRASIASSIIDASGREVVWIDDDWANAEQSGRAVTT